MKQLPKSADSLVSSNFVAKFIWDCTKGVTYKNLPVDDARARIRKAVMYAIDEKHLKCSPKGILFGDAVIWAQGKRQWRRSALREYALPKTRVVQAHTSAWAPEIRELLQGLQPLFPDNVPDCQGEIRRLQDLLQLCAKEIERCDGEIEQLRPLAEKQIAMKAKRVEDGRKGGRRKKEKNGKPHYS